MGFSDFADSLEQQITGQEEREFKDPKTGEVQEREYEDGKLVEIDKD